MYPIKRNVGKKFGEDHLKVPESCFVGVIREVQISNVYTFVQG